MDINNLDDHGSMENHPIHHQISSYDHHQYSSFWPNLPLHHQLHQIPSSSSHHHDDDVPPHDQLIGHVHHHPHHHHQGLLAAGNNHNFFMELDPHEDRDHEEQEAAAATSAAEEELGAMKEMMYKIAAMQPVDIDPATIRKPKRRNVRISDDPQSVAARHRRERISEKIRILQRLVPGGTKMDTASMLDEAIRYVKFLKRQIRLLQYSSTPSNTININNIDHGPHHQHDPHHPAPPPPPAHDDHHDPCNATTGAGLPLDWPPPNINNINDTNDHTQER